VDWQAREQQLQLQQQQLGEELAAANRELVRLREGERQAAAVLTSQQALTSQRSQLEDTVAGLRAELVEREAAGERAQACSPNWASMFLEFVLDVA
jgi:hypothetical protein